MCVCVCVCFFLPPAVLEGAAGEPGAEGRAAGEGAAAQPKQSGAGATPTGVCVCVCVCFTGYILIQLVSAESGLQHRPTGSPGAGEICKSV